MLETETFTLEKGCIVESTCLTRLGRKVDSLEPSFLPLKDSLYKSNEYVIEIKDRRSRSRNMSKISRTSASSVIIATMLLSPYALKTSQSMIGWSLGPCHTVEAIHYAAQP